MDGKVFVGDGKFRSVAFLSDGNPYPKGERKVKVEARFNSAWQNDAILHIFGLNGEKATGDIFFLTDPDVIDSPKIINIMKTLKFSPIPREVRAIEVVKHYNYTKMCKRKVLPAGELIEKMIVTVDGVEPGRGWTAAKEDDGSYRVIFNYIYIPPDGGEIPTDLIWSVDASLETSRYVNKNAKDYSCISDR